MILLTGLLAALYWPQVARAVEPEVQELELLNQPDALYLTARLSLVPTRAVEDALLKGVPLYFVWQADVYRDRWYWFDKRVNRRVRTLRLAYQPLTRRWRLSVSNEGNGDTRTELQYALHQNHGTLAEALAGVGRIGRWKLADGEQVRSGSEQRVELAFRLDLSLLPRPFQIGMANEPEWNIELQRRLVLPVQAPAAVVPSATPDQPPTVQDAAEPEPAR